MIRVWWPTSGYGPSPHFATAHGFIRFQGEADIAARAIAGVDVTNDPMQSFFAEELPGLTTDL